MKVRKQKRNRPAQGDIIRDIQHVEHVDEKSGIIEVSKIIFPLSIILTQDCDLEQDYAQRRSRRNSTNNEDKWLISVILAPIYNIEHVYSGEHLSLLGMTMNPINRRKTPGQNLRNNDTPRYHYIEFPQDIPITPSVIDFKHYYTVNIDYLRHHKRDHFICQASPLFREDISHRFSSYLSRIGLPPSS